MSCGSSVDLLTQALLKTVQAIAAQSLTSTDTFRASWSSGCPFNSQDMEYGVALPVGRVVSVTRR